MGNLKRPLVLGLSTCALLLLSSRGLKRASVNGAAESDALQPGGESDRRDMDPEETAGHGPGEAS